MANERILFTSHPSLCKKDNIFRGSLGVATHIGQRYFSSYTCFTGGTIVGCENDSGKSTFDLAQPNPRLEDTPALTPREKTSD